MNYYDAASLYCWNKPVDGAALPATGWIKTKERRPEPGTLIVKRWLPSRSVWAGVYSGTDKDSSFDEWVALPTDGKDRA